MPVGSEVAMVFLYVLAIDSAMVGMSLGVMLPSVFPGVCLGGTLALLAVSLSGVWKGYVFPVAGSVMAALFAVVSARYVVINPMLFTHGATCFNSKHLIVVCSSFLFTAAEPRLY